MHNSATFKPSLRTWISGLFVILFGLAPMASASAAEIYGMPAARVEQSRGVDSAVNYAGLAKHGLWDDRNYQLTAADLKFLSPISPRYSAGPM